MDKRTYVVGRGGQDGLAADGELWHACGGNTVKV